MSNSLDLLFEGSSRDFVGALCREALEHPAVTHNYLKEIASGSFSNMEGVLRDYAFQYSFYSREFPAYVEGAIGGLSNLEHRSLLLENLEEEKGNPNSKEFKDLPHTELFATFCRAVGIDEAYTKSHKPTPTVLVWRDLFLQKCQSRQEGVAVGAIGIATEFIVPTVYGQLLKGIKNHTNLSPKDYYFFELHANCDEEHAEDLNKIIENLAENIETREAIRFGVKSALNLRSAFWDVMYARATNGRVAN